MFGLNPQMQMARPSGLAGELTKRAMAGRMPGAAPNPMNAMSKMGPRLPQLGMKPTVGMSGLPKMAAPVGIPKARI